MTVQESDFYMTSNGFLIFPKLDNMKLLINISESTIPAMAEALEATATIPGKDGEIVLNTTYSPISFNLVIYTDDNLSVSEKLDYENKLTNFCDEMKNTTKIFAIQNANKFYKVKYSGLLEKENFPMHLKFNLPFKTSSAYGYDMTKKTITGNGSKTSNTIKPCGFQCIIKGPATNPVISLNDYDMEYSNVILAGNQLIIDTNNSTAVLEEIATGIKSNAMRFYNHQFPKITKGTNKLSVLSGINTASNVSMSWYDLVL